ncbi:MAG: DUF4388 domain-containing protein [candidate division WOR-3 bacterium]|nr:DUF4388 domain-containing protein [candidate division WOR-3 bacterium]
MADFEINLREFNLPDVLQFLIQLRKTGVIRVNGELSGEIFIKDGHIVHATDGTEKGFESLLNLSLARLEKGIFESGVRTAEQTITEDVGKLNESIERRRIEFEKIKDRLPPRDAVLAKSTKELPTAVALRRTDWQVLAMVDGKRTINEIIAQSQLGGYETIKTIVWLKEQGLIYDPKEAERLMAGLIKYLNAFFKTFGKNGLNWFKRWSELNPENQNISTSIKIDEETFEITIQNPLSEEQMEYFRKDFGDFFKNEGPQIYGKLLFKKKLEEMAAELK